MKDLPRGWEWATLDELVGVDGVFTDGDWVESKDQDPDGEIRLVQLADVGKGKFRDRSSRWINNAAFDRLVCTELRFDDILIARMPDPLGRACLHPQLPYRAITAVDVAVLRPGAESVDPRWLMWAINAPQFAEEVSRHATGTTRKRISRRNLASISLPVPPLTEQRRIVDSVNGQFDRIDQGLRSLLRADARARTLAKRILKEVVTTEKHASATTRLRLGDIARVGSGATPAKSNSSYYLDGTVPWVTSADLKQGDVREVEGRITMKAVAETSAKLWPPGCLLIAMYGEGKTRGTVAELHIEATTNQACAVIDLATEYQDMKPWIRLVLESRYEEMRTLSAGGVQPNLSLGQIRNFEIPLLSEIERDSRLHQVAKIRATQERMSAAITEAALRSEKLRNRLLESAFRGDLVDQDSTEEPAQVLLSRIREEGETAATTSRKIRKNRVRKVTAQ